MARNRTKALGQRGVAAVEFALTVPLFMALLGGMLGFGFALYTKYIVTNAANVAVRACVIQQAGSNKPSDFANCAVQTFNGLVTSNAPLPFQCTGEGGMSVQPGPDTVLATPSLDTRSRIHLLSLNVSCGLKVGNLISMGSRGNASATPVVLSVAAAMPYTLY